MQKHSRQKVYFAGSMHHVYARGVERRKIFHESNDYLHFIRRLRLYKKTYEIDLLCYCLMPNHFHLMTLQQTETPLSSMVQYLLNGYVMYFNKRNGRKGRLLEEAFWARSIGDEAMLLPLSRYIHLNPLVGGLVKKTEDWPWSSYPDYINKRGGSLCNKDFVLDGMSAAEYERYCYEDLERSLDVKIRKKLFELAGGME